MKISFIELPRLGLAATDIDTNSRPRQLRNPIALHLRVGIDHGHHDAGTARSTNRDA